MLYTVCNKCITIIEQSQYPLNPLPDDMACTTSDGIVASRQHGETVELVCSLELSGTLLPQLQWKHGNVVLNADHTSTEGEYR